MPIQVMLSKSPNQTLQMICQSSLTLIPRVGWERKHEAVGQILILCFWRTKHHFAVRDLLLIRLISLLCQLPFMKQPHPAGNVFEQQRLPNHP